MISDCSCLCRRCDPVAGEADLAQRVHDAEDRLAGVLPAGHGLLAELVPRRIGRCRGGLRLTRVGEREALAAAAGDASLSNRTWVLLTEAVEGGWGLGGHANTNAELVDAARAQIAKLQGAKLGA